MSKILICDDDLGISELIKTILEEGGYQTQGVTDGKGILKNVKTYSPDLILLDLWMPGIKGQEVIKILKENLETKNIPIIIISALNDIEKITSNTKADGFLPKPFDILDLLNIVKKHAGK